MIGARSALATTIITGTYNLATAPGGAGYSTATGDYVVPADTSGTPSATFNTNGIYGLLSMSQDTTSVSIAGGQFDHNLFGVGDYDGALSVSGGEFATNSDYGIWSRSALTTLITGGTFTNNARADVAIANAVTLEGGTFSSAVNFQLALGASLDVYGNFPGLSVGQTQTIPGTTTSSGSFTGTLENETTPQTFNYSFVGTSTIVLHEVPEPSLLALLAVGVLALRNCLRAAGVRRRRF